MFGKSFLLFVIAFAFAGNFSSASANIISNNTKMAMEEIAEIIDAKYYNNVDLGTLEDGALDGMLKALDPYSGYFDKESLSNFQQNTTGTFAGIGIETVFSSRIQLGHLLALELKPYLTATATARW